MATKKATDLLRKLSPPMLATLVSKVPPDAAQWSYELKYDGFRALAAVIGGEALLWSRNQLDLGGRFSGVVAALEKLGLPDCVLDGEIAVLDPGGVPRFQLLQKGNDDRTVFFLFDVLWLEGKDLRSLPLEERRARLEKVIPARSRKGAIRLAEQKTGEGKALLEEAGRLGWEGLIAKRKGSVYESRRSKLWIKLKAVNMQELAIIGFTPSSASDREIGALLLGVMDEGRMTYAGKVGTGFSAKQRTDLVKLLGRDALTRHEFAGAPRMREATWVTPKHVAQVRFTEWTSDGKLRHPSFLGLRLDKTPEETRREKPVEEREEPTMKGTEKGASTAAKKAATKKSASKKASKVASKKGAAKKDAAKKGAAKRAAAPPPEIVKLSSPDRLLYPKDGITKQDVADYFEAVAPAMLRALEDRPLAIEHWNQGISKPSWFQQHIGGNAEPWMTLIETPTRTSKRNVNHLVADSPAALRWLAQHSALTVHMWSSRGASLETPDWIVFDLDPAKGKGIEQAIEAALVFRRLFEQLELPSVPKTSGKRGIHLLVPLEPKYSHEEVVEFACSVADAVASKVPDFTTERSLAQRRGRLYVDCLQNGYGKTIVAPYSLRAADGAPVSAPLEWSEINKKLDPSKFNLRTMPARLAKKGDLFARVFEERVELPRLSRG